MQALRRHQEQAGRMMARKKAVVKDAQEPSSEERGDMAILDEARDRFKRCQDWESYARARGVEDLRFYNGDSENNYQWPDQESQRREIERLPRVTINKTRQLCLQIMNDAKKNKSSVKFRPAGNKASYDGAQIMEGIVRHIEYRSRAQSAYDWAGMCQVKVGVGYWRVLTRYTDNESFDQEIYIERVKDWQSVYLDPDAEEIDKSDMQFGFVYRDWARDRFDAEHPEHKDAVGQNSITGYEGWIEKDHVRVCEYYRVVSKRRKLIMLIDPDTGERKSITDKQVPKDILDEVLADPRTKTREIVDKTVEWFKIAGDKIIERNVWVGTTIPIVQIVGEEEIIDGKFDRKGHVRNIKDPNRIYNYWTSSAIENVALQTKAPYIGSGRAIEGYEEYWETANTERHSILPYNDIDDEGNPIPPPVRSAPITMAPAYVEGMKIAAEEMRMASGQYQENLGEPSNAVSGKAINARQREGENATYHFTDNQAIGIRYTGMIIAEIAPKVYDTKRIVKIMGDDGTESDVTLDPQAKQEFLRQEQESLDKVSIIFNPGFAKYSVESDIGPAYATRRQEAFNAFVQIMSANPEMMKIAGDLMFMAADFPMAGELAERLKRMVPPEVLGKGPSPEMQQLMQQNKALTAHVQSLLTQYAEERTKHVGTAQKRDVDAYRADTDRLKALMPGMTPQMIASLLAQLILESQQISLLPAVHSAVQTMQSSSSPEPATA
jgi:hypothetical protein